MQIGERIPDVRLPGGQGAGLDLRPRRAGRALVFLHGGACASCRDYVDRLRDHRAELEAWDGDVALVLPEGGDAAARLASETGLPVLTDADGEVAERFLGERRLAVLITDHFGQIWHLARADEAAGLPSPAEVEKQLKWISIQCPECGVPDTPLQDAWKPGSSA